MRARIVSYIWGTTRGGKKEEEVSMRTVLCASIGYVGKKMYQFPFHSGGDNEAFFFNWKCATEIGSDEILIHQLRARFVVPVFGTKRHSRFPNTLACRGKYNNG